MTEHRIFRHEVLVGLPGVREQGDAKQRTQQEVDQIICWLTRLHRGRPSDGSSRREVDIRTFFAEAPLMHPNSALITGVVCGVRVGTSKTPLMRKIRYLESSSTS